ncbi:phosphatidylinositol mannoside acyltransferase [Isoptericola sp. b441]|uniref:Phosphatidylinositol mannoside acyltransferase n=1 Tax=Actinotalea lenta TaxID=3064654 RepID=A0ABT9DE93_9CELL|nr:MULTISPECIES: phosphatidylinositol mannoside acyltransferase [unclassified Isoptericola]MDO8107831.1 phosphatidylinositol mannoside acyltransferase [Isoptericola sp. b441]MDO8120498.1 phosphatidylinositol mannoside acyltransferase [Isoptericola sp. b490]
MNLAARGLVGAVHLAPRVPEALVRALAAAGADAAWLRRGHGVRRLEANLATVRPDLSPRQIRSLSRAGMQNYLRYYAEAFTLAGRTPAQIDARVRVSGTEGILAETAAGRSVAVALAHQGNWDLAGAWATRNLAPITTVAERLEPPEVYDAFYGLRGAIGLRILPLDSGHDVFRELVRTAHAGGYLIPLLADRDLTERGVEVDLCGRRARVAAGPAALSVATGVPLYAAALRHERLHGARRRSARSRWGLRIEFTRVEAPAGTPRAELVRVLTQGWVDVLGADIAAHPGHWHMLQRVFVADLDASRLPSVDGAGGGAR